MNTSPTCSHPDLDTRSDAQPTLFVDLARTLFIAAHVDGLIMVRSSSQLSEDVSEMKQYFTMKVTLPLSASAAQTHVVATYLRCDDAICELPRVMWEACWKIAV